MAEKADTHVLCYLTDWQERISEGHRNKGAKIRFRFAIGVTPYQWTIVEFNEGSEDLPKNRVNAGSFRDLVGAFKTEVGISAFEGIKKVQEALETRVGLKPNLKPLSTNVDMDLALDFAHQVDAAYSTDFTIHDKVRERYFGEGGEDDE